MRYLLREDNERVRPVVSHGTLIKSYPALDNIIFYSVCYRRASNGNVRLEHHKLLPQHFSHFSRPGGPLKDRENAYGPFNKYKNVRSVIRDIVPVLLILIISIFTVEFVDPLRYTYGPLGVHGPRFWETLCYPMGWTNNKLLLLILTINTRDIIIRT